VQTVKLPDYDIETDEHGDTNYKVKTGGMVSFGMLSLSKICDATPFLDSFIWTQMRTIQDVDLGGGALPSVYKTAILVEQYGPDGLTVVQRWTLTGCWPKRVNGVEFNRAQSGNTIESIDWEIDKMRVGI
jgi:hypothetical protein